jgi:hypothetical protein
MVLSIAQPDNKKRRTQHSLQEIVRVRLAQVVLRFDPLIESGYAVSSVTVLGLDNAICPA